MVPERPCPNPTCRTDFQNKIHEMETKLTTDVGKGIQSRGRIESIEKDVTELKYDVVDTRIRMRTAETAISKTETSIAEIANSTKSITAARDKQNYFLLGLATTIILAVVAAGYSFGQLNARVDSQVSTQATTSKNVTEQLSSIESKIAQPDTQVIQELRIIKQRIENSPHNIQDSWCSKLSSEEIRQLKRTLPRDRWPGCF